MQRTLSLLFGIALIAFGALCMVGNFAFSWLEIAPFYWWQFWRLWPLIVVGIGGLLMLAPIVGFRTRGLGVLFIPGAPLLTTGSILLINSVFNWWDAWAWLWPAVVISVAAGFLLAAIFTRIVWFGIPAILIGVNAVVLAFCNITGLWGWWSVLWTVEPLALGLCFLLIAAATRSSAVAIIGALFCGFAAIAFLGMTSLFAIGGWFFQLSGPAMIIVIGLVLLAGSLLPRATSHT
ncbi:MAG: hypothetical protein ACOYYS_05355 [Chloroflexota bacterium]